MKMADILVAKRPTGHMWRENRAHGETGTEYVVMAHEALRDVRVRHWSVHARLLATLVRRPKGHRAPVLEGELHPSSRTDAPS